MSWDILLEMVGNFITDIRVIIGGGFGVVLLAIYSVKKWINAGTGAGVIVAWGLNKMINMFTSDDPESQANAESAKIVVNGLMKFPAIKSQFDKVDNMAIKFLHELEAQILVLEKQLLDLDNRIALNIDDQTQITKMIALQEKIKVQIEVLKRDSITA